MKRPILLTSMIVLFVVSDGNPFADLGAAEVWNSQNKRQITSDKRTIFNKSKSSRAGKGVTTLYNRQSYSDINTSSHGGLQAKIQSYRNVDITRQVPSKLWGLLSAAAYASKQADVNQALENEYARKKATAQVVVSAMKEYEKRRRKAQREFERSLEKANDETISFKEQQDQKRAEALRTAKAESSSSKPSSQNSSGARENVQSLKGSAKLFNSSK